ncbi:MAG TPA: hypothetical protein VKV18_12920 [Chthonomonas sp.]|uniref:hypothetical protein n=1 Tax=Chthonomonas sp. TaxID=2282153 RepID=UPI002B4B8D25|nr:hypothetical protein [Chthonomonas sp.]HLI49573.1 hypothetical protein [Chthonomonas sp.]
MFNIVYPLEALPVGITPPLSPIPPATRFYRLGIRLKERTPKSNTTPTHQYLRLYIAP